MRDKQKTREGVLGFTGSETENLEKSCWGEDIAFPYSYQEKCARCPYSGNGHACNLVPCPFSVRCRWTGERLTAGDVELVRDCIGFEERPGLDLCRSLRQGDVPLNHDRRSNRLSCFPRAGKSIAVYSAVEAPAVSSGRLSHIGGVATSSIREDWRLIVSRGALLSRLFFLIPTHEVPHD